MAKNNDNLQNIRWLFYAFQCFNASLSIKYKFIYNTFYEDSLLYNITDF